MLVAPSIQSSEENINHHDHDDDHDVEQHQQEEAVSRRGYDVDLP